MNTSAVLLGVSGCIAAYKAAELVRRLNEADVAVKVIMTAHAQRFVGALTFQALSRQPVITKMFAPEADSRIEHITLAQSHDLLLVAPATANIIGKFAHGIADDFLSTIFLSMPKPVVIAPGMNVEMWKHPAVQENVRILRARGVCFIDPEEGYLACGTVGAGRMADPQRIVDFVTQMLAGAQDFAGRRIIITAGPTVEDIDPVRLLTNRSSGKMGYALAAEALRRGAQVTLISGPVALPAPAGASLVRVRSTSQMRQAVLERFQDCDAAIMAAAVCDYSPRERNSQKIKKADASVLNLELVPTPDILAELGKIKNRQLLVGFAAETESVATAAKSKLQIKKADLMVANDVTLSDSGFDSDFNTVTLLAADDSEVAYPRLLKSEVAKLILDKVAALLGSCGKTLLSG